MKERIALVFSIILGVVAVIMVGLYIRSIKTSVYRGMEAVKIIVADKDLSQGEIITDKNIAARNYPAKYVGRRAIKVEDAGLIIGKKLKWGIQKGRPILWSDIELFEDKDVSSLIPPGKRAISIPVSEVSGVAGLIYPGAIVDILYVFDIKKLLPHTFKKSIKSSPESLREELMRKALGEPGEEKGVFFIAQNVEVLAVDNLTTYGSKSEKTEYSKTAGYSTITILVEPKLAALLSYALENGKLIFVLKNKKDTQKVKEKERVIVTEDLIKMIGGAYEKIKKRGAEILELHQ